ncbi:MAG: 30S ribosomal protein S20 [Candidatus Kapabacteria bacterium]|jgi:small subunit ribosomal protein S20|nr:30S ribosomal protein S20 [Candidatus Kapabacteria bacterium]
MAHHKSAIKRIRQTKKRNYYNRLNKKAYKKAVRAVREATEFTDASLKLNLASKILDKVVARGILHINTAANKKSKLAHFVNKMKPAVAPQA